MVVPMYYLGTYIEEVNADMESMVRDTVRWLSDSPDESNPGRNSVEWGEAAKDAKRVKMEIDTAVSSNISNSGRYNSPFEHTIMAD